MVIDSETTGAAFESGDLPNQSADEAVVGFRHLLSHWESWVLVIGVVAFLTTAITIQSFGPLMFNKAYHYTPGQAAAATANFWLINLIMLVPAGMFSDWLRVRKPITIVLSLIGFGLLYWWVKNFLPPLPFWETSLVSLVLGGILASAFIPWCAYYSEYLEDLSPALQATGWSFFQMVYRTWIAFSAPLLLWVAAHYGWQTWMWATVIGTALFIVSNLTVRGHWRPATAADASLQPAHATGGR
jgi:MFS family permease